MASSLPADDPIAEITSLDDLRRLAEAVQTANRPRLVSLPGGGQITLAPTPSALPARPNRPRPTPEQRTKADEAAFLSPFGAMRGTFDLDEFIQDVRQGRSSHRPLVVLDGPEE